MRIILGNGVEVGSKEPGGDADIVYLGNCEISMKNFFVAAKLILEGSNLFEDDSRPEFVEYVKSMETVKSCSLGEEHLKAFFPL